VLALIFTALGDLDVVEDPPNRSLERSPGMSACHHVSYCKALRDVSQMCYNLPMQDESLTIRIDSELKARLKERSVVEKRSVAYLVVRAIEAASKKWKKHGTSTTAD
jgi:hypothetical protein